MSLLTDIGSERIFSEEFSFLKVEPDFGFVEQVIMTDTDGSVKRQLGPT
jgi:hypothetical protein